MNREGLVNALAFSVCGKPPFVSCTECLQSHESISSYCRERNSCRIQEKSDQQLDYVLHPRARDAFLHACPGSGKTEVVGLKAAKEISEWNDSPGGLAVLTFTTNAASTILERTIALMQSTRIGFPHFIGTFDSWLHSFIAHPFSHWVTGYPGRGQDHSLRLVESTSRARFLNSFKTNYAHADSGYISAHEYYLDEESQNYVFESSNRKVDALRMKYNWESWQIDDLRRTKTEFLSKGFATYRDIENLCLQLLSTHHHLRILLSHRFPYVIVDECQDLSWTQIQILHHLRICGTNIHLVGDLSQAIYDFRQVHPEKVAKYASNNSFDSLTLSTNFRCCQAICDLCSRLTHGSLNIISGQTNSGTCACLYTSYKRNNLDELPTRFAEILRSRNIDVSKSVILTRNRVNVHRILGTSNHHGNVSEALPNAIKLWSRDNESHLSDCISKIGELLSSTFFAKYNSYAAQQYRPEIVDSPLKWRLFVFAVLDKCSADPDISNLDQKWSSWSSIIRKKLPAILEDSLKLLSLKDKVETKLFSKNTKGENYPIFRSPQGKANVVVSDTLPFVDQERENLKVTTIHSVKGQTFDAVMLVSAPKKSGTNDGHWTNWLDVNNKQATRLAYVACSRPRFLLVWAVPQISEKEANDIELLEFNRTGC